MITQINFEDLQFIEKERQPGYHIVYRHGIRNIWLRLIWDRMKES